MTAAAVSKRMKAKGLGRLRWYCQMCEKQCRDENGFKNHTDSAGHKRQVSIFAENPSEYTARFSDTFRKEFLLVLRRRYGTSSVAANTVYQEYIKDRHHLHMNATRWSTLTEFVKELGREGLCRVQDREDGWWITYVDRAAAEKERRAREMDRRMLEQEHRAETALRQKLKEAREARTRRSLQEKPEVLEPLPDVDIAPIKLDGARPTMLEQKNWDKEKNPLDYVNSKRQYEDDEAGDSSQPKKKRRSRWDERPTEGPRLSALDEIMRKEKQTKIATSAEDHKAPSGLSVTNQSVEDEEDGPAWILKGIAVKVMNKEVGAGTFYRRKGVIIDVIEEYGARVKLVEGDTVLELDQDDLETVIPKNGGEVVLLRGKHRGEKAILMSIHVEAFSVDVQLQESGEILRNLEYESISRLG